MITSRMIEAFHTVIITGGVTKAANAMYISQPAVSRLIRDLESATDLVLFDRQRGRLFVTNEGIKLFEEIEHTFVGLKHIEETAKRIKKGEVGQLKIVCMPVLALNIMPHLIGKYIKFHPDIDVSLKIIRSSAALRYLTTQQCDIAFVETTVSSPVADELALLQAPCFCLLPPGHRLSQKEVIRPNDLKNETFISLDKKSKLRLLIDAIFENKEINRKCQIETNMTKFAGYMVLEGLGVSILDVFTAKALEKHGVVAKPFRPSVHFLFRSLSNRNSTNPKLIRQFHEMFLTELQDTADVVKNHF